MAESLLLLRRGKLENLSQASLKDGAISFTTDEPAIYLDVKNDEGQVVRKRIGDLINYNTRQDLLDFLANTPKEEWPVSALYYIVDENALLKWTGGENGEWKQLNSISDITANVTELNDTVFGTVGEDGQRHNGLVDKVDALTNTLGNKEDVVANDEVLVDIIHAKASTDTAGKVVITDDEGYIGFSTITVNELGVLEGINTDSTLVEQLAALSEATTALETYVKGTKNAEGKFEGGLEQKVDANTANIAAHANAIADLTNNKANAADVYNKTEVDDLLDDKADASALGSYYNKTEVDNLLDDKADATALENYYNKDAIDGKFTAVNTALEGKVDNSDLENYYTSEEIDATVSGLNESIGKKANTTDVYTKAEADGLLNAKANVADVYTKTDIDGKVTTITNTLNDKANSADVYKKTETYSQAEVNNLLANKADKTALDEYYKKTETYNQTEVDAKFEAVKETTDALTNDHATIRGEIASADEALKKAITDEYKEYVDNKIQTADAMVFMGVVDGTSVLLPTADVERGHTYKAGANFKVGEVQVYVGDLLIANADQTSESYPTVIGETGETWSLISSGYEDDHDVHLAAEDENNLVKIVNAAGQNRGDLTFASASEEDGGVVATVTSVVDDAASGVTSASVKFELVWGSF